MFGYSAVVAVAFQLFTVFWKGIAAGGAMEKSYKLKKMNKVF